VKRLFGLRAALSSSISRMNGTLPASRIQVAVASGNARLRYQLSEKYTQAAVLCTVDS